MNASDIGASGTLTLTTADPLTGGQELRAHFVSATAGARPLRWRADEGGSAEAGLAPSLLAPLEAMARAEDARCAHPVSIEWVVERGVATLIRVAPQALAATPRIRALVERVEAGRLERADAVLAVEADELEKAGTLALVAAASSLVARGVPASPGVVVGELATAPNEVVDGCIWVVEDLSSEDAPWLRRAGGVVATSGGVTSDAAVMARALRKPCVVSATLQAVAPVRGEPFTLDGASGELHRGALPVRWAPATPHAAALLGWAEEISGDSGRPGPILTRAHEVLRSKAPSGR